MKREYQIVRHYYGRFGTIIGGVARPTTRTVCQAVTEVAVDC